MSGFMVRDVVDMDVALHGRRFIVVEFVLMVAFGVAFAALELYLGATRGSASGFQLPTGIYVAAVTLNCATFLLLALRGTRPIAPTTGRAMWLTVVALLLLGVPLVFPMLAITQKAAASTG